MKTVGEQTEKDALTAAQRGGELVSVAVMLLVSGFFVSHQVAHTGFFTAKFGAVEMVCLCLFVERTRERKSARQNNM